MRFILMPVLVLLGFALVHLFKFIRFYLVLMELGLPLTKCISLYVETTCVNLIIPFKLGEIFRIWDVWHATDMLDVSVIAVLTDRFFDTASLVGILLFLVVMGVSPMTWILPTLLILVIAVACFYLGFPSAFRYLNRHLILYKTSGRSMWMLELLEKFNDYHIWLQRLVSGRAWLMIIFSCFGWIAEGFTLSALACLLGGYFGFGDYARYIGSIFSGTGSELLRVYSVFGAGILLILTIIFRVILWVSGRRNHEKDHCADL